MFPCPKCKKILPNSKDCWQHPVICLFCGERVFIRIFPALLAHPETDQAQSVLSGSESSCFYHSDKIAIRSCEHCGRFLCGLCDIAVDQQHLCPTCLAKGKDTSSVVDGLKSHSLHDSIALSVAILPLIFFPVTLLTAPMVFSIIYKNYKKSLGLIPRKRWRFWLAGFFATLELGGWLTIFFNLRS